jgi:hypothetical protein
MAPGENEVEETALRSPAVGSRPLNENRKCQNRAGPKKGIEAGEEKWDRSRNGNDGHRLEAEGVHAVDRTD